jgi:hypothetical protein
MGDQPVGTRFGKVTNAIEAQLTTFGAVKVVSKFTSTNINV